MRRLGRLFAGCRFVAGLVAGVVSAACGRGSPSSVEVHPNAANAPPTNAAAIASEGLPVGLGTKALARWRATRAALLDARTELELGTGQLGPELFGYIPMADIDAAGNIVLLDEDAQEVRIFDSRGNFVESFGGRGDGPMELRRAHTLELLPGGRVAVPLGRTGPVKIFGRGRQGWELEEIIDLKPTPGNDLCAFGDGRLFATGYQRQGNRLVSDLSEPIRSLGFGYRHPHQIIRRALSGGLIDCIELSGHIVFGFEIRPILRSYGLDGSLRWTAVIADDYLQLQVAELRHPKTGAIGYAENAHFDHDRLYLVAATKSGEHVLAQYGRVLPEKKEILPRSYLIDAATGIGASIGDALPNVLSIQEDGYIALFEEPEVRLEIRKIGQIGHNDR